MTGLTEAEYATQLYRNDGGSFSAVAVGLPGSRSGTVAWGDYDNDGDPDILLVGGASSGALRARIYRNDGGTFSDIGAGLPETNRESSGAWGDYDNDGDLDILLAGWLGGSSDAITRVYRNDGGGTFTDIDAGMTGMFRGSSAWGDYDNDGDLDILLTGSNMSAFVTLIYRNDDGSFADSGIDSLPAGGYGSAVWGDYNGDGDLDILLSGYVDWSTFAAGVYSNEDGGYVQYFPWLTKNARP